MDFFSNYADLLKPVEREIVHRGRKAKFHFKELSYEDAQKILNGNTASGEESGVDISRAFLVATLCDDGGQSVLDEASVKKLSGPLLKALFEEACAINGFGEKAKEEAGNAP